MTTPSQPYLPPVTRPKRAASSLTGMVHVQGAKPQVSQETPTPTGVTAAAPLHFTPASPHKVPVAPRICDDQQTAQATSKEPPRQ